MTSEKASNLICRFNALFDNDPCISVDTVEFEDEVYYVTSGTGDGNFAYEESDFESGIEAAEEVETEVYQEFCDNTAPVSKNSKLANLIYDTHGVRICNPGSCSPMY